MWYKKVFWNLVLGGILGVGVADAAPWSTTSSSSRAKSSSSSQITARSSSLAEQSSNSRVTSSSSNRFASSSSNRSISSSSNRNASSSSRQLASSSSAKSSSSGKSNKTKTIRFLTPWTNTSAILYVSGDSVTTMKSVDKYCGWFQASVSLPTDNPTVYFKQTIGKKYYSMAGIEANEPTIDNEISLDSIALEGDTIWIRSYKTDAPLLSSDYPNALGDCPVKNLPVMMFDWYDGSRDNHKKFNPTTRDESLCNLGEGYNHCTTTYGGIGTSANFGGDNVNLCWPNSPVSSKKYYEEDRSLTDYAASAGKVIENMVLPTLGKNNVPVRNDAFDWDGNCRNADSLNRWFLPETLLVKNGKAYTNATCRNLTLVLDDDGIWRAQMNTSADESTGEARGGMFLIDDFQFLDDEKTIPNPYYDSIPSGIKGIDGSGTASSNPYHNYGMSMKAQAKFEYVPGQYFEFLGDDDVWVFINGRLVVDIGGIHTSRTRAVDLDTLGLTPDSTYTFQIFYTERYKVEGNFKMRTSMDLKADAGMFVVSDTRGTQKTYDIWQINKTEALSCDFSVDAQTTTDTTGGKSTFHLTGNNLDTSLTVGTWFEGIIITSDSTFAIDSAAIYDNYALDPGHYFLEVFLKDDPSQSLRIEITVPFYNAPSVAFADSAWNVLGTEVSGDTLQIGKWAYEKYKVNVTFKEESAVITDYNKNIRIAVSDPLLNIIDEDGKSISKITLDENKQASFYVMANGKVEGATITLTGAANTKAYWTELNFDEPPVPHVTIATLYDRNGDGRGDSLYAEFDKPFDSQIMLTDLQITFGEVQPQQTVPNFSGNILELTSGDCIDGSPCGFGTLQFTGASSGEAFMGSMTTYITYIEKNREYNFTIKDEPVSDGIGPIVKSATKRLQDGNHILTVTFSEAIADSTKKYFMDMFQYKCVRGGIVSEAIKPNSQTTSKSNEMSMLFVGSGANQVIPSVGDKVRFTPFRFGGLSALDVSGNGPNENNPWVSITGEQEMAITSAGIVTVNQENPIVSGSSATVPVLITDVNADAKQVTEENGVQGHLIGFDVATLISDQTKGAIASLDNFIADLMDSGTQDTMVTEISRDSAITKLFEDIVSGSMGGGYGISDSVLSAIIDGTITKENYTTRGLLSEDDLNALASLIETNIENSRDTTITTSFAGYHDLESVFAAIQSGEISEKTLKQYGVDQRVITAIKDGNLNANTIDSYRNGDASLIDPDEVKLSYQTRYYSHLGHYVNGESGTIRCSDPVYGGPDGTENCLTNNGNIFLAWNMRSSSGKMVATGVYVARLEFKISVSGKTIKDQTRDFLWGVRR